VITQPTRFEQRTSIGLDVHARSVAGCGLDGQTGEVFQRRLTPDPAQIADWITSLPQPVQVAYEAGPTGYGLARYLAAAQIRCQVAAPSKLQRPSGDRVKNDKRDAFQLARLVRLGDIVEVAVPTVEQEAARDLVRARDAARADLMRVRHRLSKFLLRHGIVYSGGTAWTDDHDRWLRAQRFDLVGTRATFDTCYEQVLFTTDRRDRLDHQIAELAPSSEYAPIVHRLCCLRGISLLTGFGLAVEIGDWTRFSGGTIAAYLGLVPSESSSGESRSQGSITKAGNRHARRLLVEAAWHHNKPYRPSRPLRARWQAGGPAAAARGHQGNQRLRQRWLMLNQQKKEPAIACVAVARELAGWCWSLATLE
jgi:transposase